jgi:hypothetical protein
VTKTHFFFFVFSLDEKNKKKKKDAIKTYFFFQRTYSVLHSNWLYDTEYKVEKKLVVEDLVNSTNLKEHLNCHIVSQYYYEEINVLLKFALSEEKNLLFLKKVFLFLFFSLLFIFIFIVKIIKEKLHLQERLEKRWDWPHGRRFIRKEL